MSEQPGCRSSLQPFELVLSKANPPQELRIPRAEIASIHLIVHVDEVS